MVSGRSRAPRDILDRANQQQKKTQPGQTNSKSYCLPTTGAVSASLLSCRIRPKKHSFSSKVGSNASFPFPSPISSLSRDFFPLRRFHVNSVVASLRPLQYLIPSIWPGGPDRPLHHTTPHLREVRPASLHIPAQASRDPLSSYP